jgi:uncharacterized protein (TIGR03083 family)
VTPQPPPESTRLDAERYLAHLRADLDELLASATSLELPVPGCPPWTVADLISHVVGVYRHKLAALEGTSAPGQDEEWGAIAAGEDPRVVLRATGDQLIHRLAGLAPETPAWSWWPAEQTVGFWQRRMAQETAVHRWDAQSALDGVEEAEPIDDELAIDGVDEVLSWLTWPWDEVPQDDATGQQVMVATGDRAWTVTLHRTSVEVQATASDAAGALVAGEPSELLLHLWGRPVPGAVATAGDTVALGLLRARLDLVVS